MHARTTLLAVLFTLSASVLSAPTPQMDNVLTPSTSPFGTNDLLETIENTKRHDDNVFEDKSSGNGQFFEDNNAEAKDIDTENSNDVDTDNENTIGNENGQGNGNDNPVGSGNEAEAEGNGNGNGKDNSFGNENENKNGNGNGNGNENKNGNGNTVENKNGNGNKVGDVASPKLDLLNPTIN